MNKLIKKYPKTSFMVINKILWCIGFFYTIYIIQNEVPNLRQWMLGSIYTIITLPISYYLTYSFGDKDNMSKQEISPKDLKVVYIASPYSHKSRSVMRERFDKVCIVQGSYLKKYGSTHTFIGPIAMAHPIAQRTIGLPTDWEFWQTHDKAIIKKCDEMWVVAMDGWKESKGVNAEIAFANNNNIPVRIMTEGVI